MTRFRQHSPLAWWQKGVKNLQYLNENVFYERFQSASWSRTSAFCNINLANLLHLFFRWRKNCANKTRWPDCLFLLEVFFGRPNTTINFTSICTLCNDQFYIFVRQWISLLIFAITEEQRIIHQKLEWVVCVQFIRFPW